MFKIIMAVAVVWAAGIALADTVATRYDFKNGDKSTGFGKSIPRNGSSDFHSPNILFRSGKAVQLDIVRTTAVQNAGAQRTFSADVTGNASQTSYAYPTVTNNGFSSRSHGFRGVKHGVVVNGDSEKVAAALSEE